MGKYKLTERFTSRDGRMEVDPRQYGMTQHGLDVVGNAKPHLGGATMIFTRIDGGPENETHYFTRDNRLNFVRGPKPESGWSVWELNHNNAGYNPDRGEVGWWNAKVEAAESEVADSIGLPHSEHISTFLVFTWDENNIGGGPDVPVEPPTEDSDIFAVTITLSQNGVSQTYKGIVTKE